MLELTGEHLHLAVSAPYGAMLGGHMMLGLYCAYYSGTGYHELPALTFSR